MKFIAKNLITSLTTLVLILFPSSISLGNQPVEPQIAIIDTAINANSQFLKSSITYEVCILENSLCPNGIDFMEGTGAAFLPDAVINKNGFDHGTLMSSVAINSDPDVKIIFIRMIGSTASGNRGVNGEASLNKVLKWVIENQQKYNIQSVVIPQGHHNLGKDLNSYCPKTPITENAINKLLQLGVPTFLPVGNGRDYQRIDWPSCIPSAFSIGATMPTKEIAIYSNFDSKLTDFFAQGTTQGINPRGQRQNIAGTSASAVTAATHWLKVKRMNPNLTFQDISSLFNKYSVTTNNSKIKGGKLIDHESLFLNIPK